MFFESPFVYLLFFPVSILYLETVARIACFGFGAGFSLYVLLFSLVIGMFLTLLSGLFGPRGNRFVSTLLLVLVTIVIYGQTLYYTIFRTFMVLSSVTMAGDVTDYWREILVGVGHSAVPFLLMLLPLIVWRLFAIKSLPDERLPLVVILILLAASVLSHFVVAALVKGNTQGIMSASYLYTDSFIPDLAADRFGILTMERLDAKNLLFESGEEEVPDEPVPSESAEPSEEPSQQPVEYGENAMDIDFDSLIANTTDKTLLSMHKYFSEQPVTEKNEYTGLWEGKNLIWICAEGFSRYALNETATPTLCKLAKEGIVCENFYDPVWSVSTSDGEYVQLTGLLPKSGVRSFARTADKPNLMYFTMGIQLSSLGYDTRAYHDHTYNYYGRDKSHPNMGYIYKALGNGLDVKKTWPESDLEMMQLSIPEYIDNEPFHVYYMTVSGHLNYTFMGNAMAKKNQSVVEDLPYSEGPLAYLACNHEFDSALAYLLDQLDQAGELENTAIVIAGDHYPYGLTLDEMEELYGGQLDETFEMYRSTCILWSGDMADQDPIVVDKPVSTLDMLPTVSNLMGLEYDSRLLMGHDIFSDADPLVIFRDRSFITDKGRYSATAKTFTPNEGVEVPEGYAKSIMSIVNNKFTYSKLILEQDYYRVLFG